MKLSNTQFSTALSYVLPLMSRYLHQSPNTPGVQRAVILHLTFRQFKMTPLRCLETSAQINQWRGARSQKDGRSQSLSLSLTYTHTHTHCNRFIWSFNVVSQPVIKFWSKRWIPVIKSSEPYCSSFLYLKAIYVLEMKLKDTVTAVATDGRSCRNSSHILELVLR
jgi:hypothetical protein